LTAPKIIAGIPSISTIVPKASLPEQDKLQEAAATILRARPETNMTKNIAKAFSVPVPFLSALLKVLSRCSKFFDTLLLDRGFVFAVLFFKEFLEVEK
jgi:hypothetical protein